MGGETPTRKSTNGNRLSMIPTMCKAQSIKKYLDYCGRPTVKGGEYCDRCTCIIRGCRACAVVRYPLLPGEPRFCSKHHTRKYAGPYGCEVE
jgi:hypothetical protein